MADHDGFADVRRERRVEIAKALEADAVGMDLARLGDRQQEQVELLNAFRQAR